EPARLTHRRDRRQRVGPLVEGDEFGDVDVGDAVAIGHAKRLVAEIFPDALHPSAGHGRFAGVDARDIPRLDIRPMDLHRVALEVEGHIGGADHVVVEERLDHVALVSAAYDEIVESIGGVDLHDVPKNGPAADLDERLRPYRAFLANARSESTGKNDNFHAAPLPCSDVIGATSGPAAISLA